MHIALSIVFLRNNGYFLRDGVKRILPSQGSSPFDFISKTNNPARKCGVICFGALEGTRTPDLLVRSQSLYPAELRAHFLFLVLIYISTFWTKSQRQIF